MTTKSLYFALLILLFFSCQKEEVPSETELGILGNWQIENAMTDEPVSYSLWEVQTAFTFDQNKKFTETEPINCKSSFLGLPLTGTYKINEVDSTLQVIDATNQAFSGKLKLVDNKMLWKLTVLIENNKTPLNITFIKK
jgi:hypothetical protein